MVAPNLVYATIQGYYPRLLADDGIHESLVLPERENAIITFDFYSGLGVKLVNPTLIDAIYTPPSGNDINLTITGSQITFPDTLEPGGWATIKVDVAGTKYDCYPFRVWRPTPRPS